MSQIRYLIPTPETATSRNAMALEVVDVLVPGFFEMKGFERPDSSAEELINVVAESIFDEIHSFSPNMTAPLEFRSSWIFFCQKRNHDSGIEIVTAPYYAEPSRLGIQSHAT